MFDNNFNNSNNDFNFKPIFNQNGEEKSDIKNINPMNYNEIKDIPPELGEIRNLTESPNAQAPTLDVLSPMNIMPLNPISNNDILDSYEKGINLNQINSLSNNISIENEIQNSNINQNKDYSFDNNFNNKSINENSIAKNNEYSIVNDSLNESIINKDFTANAFLTEATNQEYVIDERIRTQENILSSDEDFSIDDNIDYKKYYNNIFIPEKDEETNNSTGIIDSNQNIKDELLELGIDDIYSEPDTLEIIDIETENIKEKEAISYNESILQIKDLCEMLKEKGVKIKLEDFDFEDMYQLIIKIDK